jgi:hypothetical protein
MSYDPNQYSTGEGYETVGDDEEIGAAPFAAQLRRPQLQPANRRQPAALRFNPAAFMRPGMASPQAQPITEARARQLIDERLANLVPWNSIPPRPKADEAMFPLGLGGVTFVNGGPTTLQLIARPQRAFRGERLVISQQKALSAGQFRQVAIVDIKVGDVSQKVGGGSLPVEVFASDAFGVRLMLDAAVPGVDITLTLDIGVAPNVGDFISIAGALIGRATESQG